MRREVLLLGADGAFVPMAVAVVLPAGPRVVHLFERLPFFLAAGGAAMQDLALSGTGRLRHGNGKNAIAVRDVFQRHRREFHIHHAASRACNLIMRGG